MGCYAWGEGAGLGVVAGGVSEWSGQDERWEGGAISVRKSVGRGDAWAGSGDGVRRERETDPVVPETKTQGWQTTARE